MRLTKVLSLVTLVSGLVYAKTTDQCKEIKKSLKDKAYYIKCIQDQEGIANELKFDYGVMKKDDFENIFSYDIRNLSITHSEDEVHEPSEEYTNELNDLSNLKNLKNLHYLAIEYNVYSNPCSNLCHYHYLAKIGKNTFKGLNKLVFLNLFGIHLSQDNINEIGTLTNLKFLNLDYCYFGDVTDFSPLKNLKNVNYLSALTNALGYENVTYDAKIPGDFVNSFKSLKELSLTSGDDSINYSKFTNIENLSVDFVKDTSFLKKYTNLKYLTIEPGNDLSILRKVPSIVDLTISHKPHSHGYASYPYQDLNVKFSENNNIEKLLLDGIQLTDSNVKEIFKLKKLKHVDFVRCSFEYLSDKYYEKLKNFNNRCPINVAYSGIYEYGLDRDEPTDYNCKSTPTTTTTTTKKTTTVKKTTTTTTKKTTTVKKTTTTTEKVPTSTVEGKCGPDYGACAVAGSCCSKHGWCGKTNDHCGVGCQPKYGLCN